jgi:hypothetical protein
MNLLNLKYKINDPEGKITLYIETAIIMTFNCGRKGAEVTEDTQRQC